MVCQSCFKSCLVVALSTQFSACRWFLLNHKLWSSELTTLQNTDQKMLWIFFSHSLAFQLVMFDIVGEILYKIKARCWLFIAFGSFAIHRVTVCVILSSSYSYFTSPSHFCVSICVCAHACVCAFCCTFCICFSYRQYIFLFGGELPGNTSKYFIWMKELVISYQLTLASLLNKLGNWLKRHYSSLLF